MPAVAGPARAHLGLDRVVLDMDSSESPVHGQHEGGAYNGHFESVGYHPLFLFTDHGDCVAAKLRPGNVSSADDWDELLVPEIDRQQAQGKRVAFRADAAFARPAIDEALEARGVQYAIRMPANKHLELAIEDLLFRSPGRPSHTPLVRYKRVRDQAESWTPPRRIVTNVEHHVGELFPRVSCIVTNLPLSNRAVVRFYNKRGNRRAMDQGRQAGGALDASVVSSVPGERGPLAPERAGLQPPEPLAPAGAAETHRALVVDQSPAAPRQDRWAASQARPLLLAVAGGEPPDPTPVRGDAAADLGAPSPGRLTRGECKDAGLAKRGPQ